MSLPLDEQGAQTNRNSGVYHCILQMTGLPVRRLSGVSTGQASTQTGVWLTGSAGL